MHNFICHYNAREPTWERALICVPAAGKASAEAHGCPRKANPRDLQVS